MTGKGAARLRPYEEFAGIHSLALAATGQQARDREVERVDPNALEPFRRAHGSEAAGKRLGDKPLHLQKDSTRSRSRLRRR